MNSVAKKMAWVERHLVDTKDSFAKRIVSYMIYLSVFDSAVWSLIFHLFDPLVMPGLVHAAAKVKQDRASFVGLLSVIREHLVNTVSKSDIQQILSEAVGIELDLIEELKELALGKLQLGDREVNFELLKQKILFDSGRVCSMLKVSPVFEVKVDPMSWIDVAYAKERSRYEEKKAVKIVKNTPIKTKESLSFTMDADF